MKKRIKSFLLIITIVLAGCQKIHYYPDDPVLFERSQILAHRGGGNLQYRDDTYEGCVHALPFYDGIEVDIQISKDQTIWLGHSSDMLLCDGSTKCFVETTDDDIESITTCNGSDISYSKLEDVMKYMDDNDIRKYISIDMKGWSPCNAGTLDIEGLMRLEVEKVIDLGDKYHLTQYLLFENELPTVLNWAQKKSDKVGTFLYSYGNFEQQMLIALKNGLDGLSYKADYGDTLNTDRMNLLHKKGLKVMAWNIADSSSRAYLESIQVDLLQVDIP